MANLLIVDDEEALASALQELFTKEGHTARALTSGQTALEAIRDELPDLTIADVLMPSMTLPQLLEIVRTHPKGERVPFLLISASITLEQEGAITAPDNAFHLRKPFEVDVLLETVVDCLEQTSGAE